jgi:hypothetical protein
MERPQIVLIVLVASGLALGGFFYGSNQRSMLTKEHQRELRAQEQDLSSEIAKLRQQLEEGGQDPTGPDELLPEGSNSSSAEGRLQEQIAFLEGQLDLLRDENARLLQLVDRLETKLNSAGSTGEGRTFSVEEEKARTLTEEFTSASRELEFKRPVEIAFTDWDGMAEAIAGTIRPQRSPEQRAQLSRAYAAMGFVTPATDVTAEVTKLLTSQLGAALYTGGDRILFNQDGNLNSVYDRTSLASALTQALQDQNFDLGKVPVPTGNNDDCYAAAKALLLGDTSIIKLRYQMFNVAPPGDDLRSSPTSLSREDFAATTPFIREYFLFPYTMGSSFCAALHGNGGWKAINAAIQRPPVSTAEILHPDLYLAAQPFVPEAYAWDADRLRINGSEPLWSNVAGELGISVYLNRGYFKYNMSRQAFYDADLPPLSKSDLQNSPPSLAAAGWRGDRYLVYPNGEGAGGSDHTYWRSKWETPNDAAEFFHGARVALAYAHDITLEKDDYYIDPEPGQRAEITPATVGTLFEHVSDKGRHLRIELNPETSEVTIINAADKPWLDALQKLK